MSKHKRPSLVSELERDRKYDSYVDEYRRMVTFGTSIVTHTKERHQEIWDYTLDLLLKSFKPKLNRDDLIAKMTIKSKKIDTLVLAFDAENIISIEQKGADGTLKRITLTNMGSTYFSKYSRIDYEIMYKSPLTQIGFKSSINKHVMKKREKIRAANIAQKICRHFNVEPATWVKNNAQSSNK